MELNSKLNKKLILLGFFTILSIINGFNTNNTTSHVNTLDDNNFTEFNSTTEFYFIEFYAPWCNHCKSLSPIYEEAARLAAETGLNCKFAKIDGENNKDLIINWEVDGYPTIFFVNNNLNKRIIYDERNEVDSFINYIIRNSKEFKKLKIDSMSEFEIIEKNQDKIAEKSYILIFANEKIHQEEINKIMDISEYLTKTYDKIFSINLNQETQEILKKINPSLKINLNNIYLFSRLLDIKTRTFEDYELIKITENEWESQDSLKNALDSFSFFLFKPSTHELIGHALESGNQNFIIFYDQEISKNNTETNKKNLLTQEFIKDIEKYSAENLRKDILISYTTLEDPNVKFLVDVLKLQKNQLPIFLLTKTKEGTNEDLDKYIFENAQLTKEAVEDFVNKLKSNKLDKFLTSENIPLNKTDVNGIYRIVGKNFDEFLSNFDKDILLIICSKFSKICKKFNKILENLTKIFKDNENLLIGQTDPISNEYKVDIEQIFPGIIFMPKPSSKISSDYRFNGAAFYEGEITTKNLKEFILLNTKFTLKISHLENEVELFANETLMKNKITPSKFNINSDEDFEFSNIFDGAGQENNLLADMFKNIGENFPTNPENSMENNSGKTNLEHLQSLKDLLFKGLERNGEEQGRNHDESGNLMDRMINGNSDFENEEDVLKEIEESNKRIKDSNKLDEQNSFDNYDYNQNYMVDSSIDGEVPSVDLNEFGDLEKYINLNQDL